MPVFAVAVVSANYRNRQAAIKLQETRESNRETFADETFAETFVYPAVVVSLPAKRF